MDSYIKKQILSTKHINSRSLESWRIKGIKESTLGKDSLVSVMHHGPRDHWLIGLVKKRKMSFGFKNAILVFTKDMHMYTGCLFLCPVGGQLPVEILCSKKLHCIAVLKLRKIVAGNFWLIGLWKKHYSVACSRFPVCRGDRKGNEATAGTRGDLGKNAVVKKRAFLAPNLSPLVYSSPQLQTENLEQANSIVITVALHERTLSRHLINNI